MSAILKIRRRIAFKAIEAAESVRRIEPRLRHLSGIIAGCGCGERYSWQCNQHRGKYFCTCSCHVDAEWAKEQNK